MATPHEVEPGLFDGFTDRRMRAFGRSVAIG
jgi:hypothetical protein